MSVSNVNCFDVARWAVIRNPDEGVCQLKGKSRPYKYTYHQVELHRLLKAGGLWEQLQHGDNGPEGPPEDAEVDRPDEVQEEVGGEGTEQKELRMGS